MLILAFDTCTAWQSVALMDGGRLLAETNVLGTSSHSETLMQTIRDVLQAAGKQPADVRLVATSLGPGSYTGLRIGVATAKSLAFALSCPLIGIPSLQAVARAAVMMCPPDHQLVPLIDARRDMVFTARYRSVEGEIRLLDEPRSVTFEDLIQSITEKSFLCGPGLAIFADKLVDREFPLISLQHYRRPFIEAAVLAEMARERYQLADLDDPLTLVPLYVRPPDIRWQTISPIIDARLLNRSDRLQSESDHERGPR